MSLSPDGKTLYYCTNANDIERRHIWAVSTSGGAPRQVSTGDGVERDPVPLASGKKLAVLYFNAAVPASVATVNVDGGAPKVIYPTLPASFPAAAHVTPQIVITHAADGLELHNQLFLPKDLKPGEKRPAMIFVHGGPVRQMLPAYHYMQFYHWAYAFNQWLADQGYIVMSINYRSGVGYGRSFRQAPGTEARGNSEYQDVVAGGKYLQSRPDVDASRVGIWGLSYGGLLTSQALARNSDMFVAGVDLAGVHLYGQSLADTALSYRSSAISAIDTWKSPVFLLQGDDDRNVDFSQMIGLVQLLRAHNVYYELTVIPDDQHESMIHSNWVNDLRQDGRLPAPVRLGKADAAVELRRVRLVAGAVALLCATAPAVAHAQKPLTLEIRSDNDAFNFWKSPFARPDEEYTSGVRAALRFPGAAPWERWLHRRAEPCAVGVVPCASHTYAFGQDIYTGELEFGRHDAGEGYPAERGVALRAGIVADRTHEQPGRDERHRRRHGRAGARRGHAAKSCTRSRRSTTGRSTGTRNCRSSPESRWRGTIPSALFAAGEGKPFGADVEPHAGASFGNILTEARAGMQVRAGFRLRHPWLLAAIDSTDTTPAVSFVADATVHGVARNEFLAGTMFRSSARVTMNGHS